MAKKLKPDNIRATNEPFIRIQEVGLGPKGGKRFGMKLSGFGRVYLGSKRPLTLAVEYLLRILWANDHIMGWDSEEDVEADLKLVKKVIDEIIPNKRKKGASR